MIRDEKISNHKRKGTQAKKPKCLKILVELDGIEPTAS